LFGFAGGIEGEAIVFVVEAGDFALHPGIEFFVGEFLM